MRRGAEVGSLLFALILVGCAAAPPPVYISGPTVPDHAPARPTTRATVPRAAPKPPEPRLNDIERELRALRDRLPD